MRFTRRSPLLLLCMSSALMAQEPRFGFAFNLVVPTGSYYRSVYGPTAAAPLGQKETYDAGIGAQFTASFPLEPRTAIRLNISAHSADGTNSAMGEPDVNLEHSLFSVGAELQFFSLNAYRHRGVYGFAGISADMERYGRSYGQIDFDYTKVERKTRLGGTIGVGRSMGFDSGMRFTLEAAYHKTLTGCDVDHGDPQPTDFVKLSFGWVF